MNPDPPAPVVAADSPPVAGPAAGNAAARRVTEILSRLGPLLGLIAVWLLFAILDGRNFIAWENQRLMLLQTAVVGTAAVGATLIIISGGIDLSVGATIALGTVVIALLLQHGYSPGVAAAGGIAAALINGALIGGLVIGHFGRIAAVLIAIWVFYAARSAWGIAGAGLAAAGTLAALFAVSELAIKRVPLLPFIVTLGTWGAFRGAAKGLAGNQVVSPGEVGWLGQLMWNQSKGLGSIMAPGVWLLLGLALLMGGVLRYTRFGRHVFAIGSNEATARLCGVRVERTKLLVYVVGVGCAGLAAILQFSFLSLGDPTTANGMELQIIAAVVIGGASLSGGQGTILGTIVGALIMTVVDNGCTKRGWENWVQEIVTGAIIVAAVALDRWRHRSAG